MQEPGASELLALSSILDVPVLKELLRSLFAERQFENLRDCRDATMADKHHSATVAAARAEAFGDVVGILQEFVDKYGKKEESEEGEESEAAQ